MRGIVPRKGKKVSSCAPGGTKRVGKKKKKSRTKKIAGKITGSVGARRKKTQVDKNTKVKKWKGKVARANSEKGSPNTDTKNPKKRKRMADVGPSGSKLGSQTGKNANYSNGGQFRGNKGKKKCQHN